MRDDLRYDSYRRYKRGTEKVATWLVSAAKLCGVKIELEVESDTASNSKHYLIPTANLFIELATAVAESKDPTIEISREIIWVLEEVISHRKAFTTFFQQLSTSGEAFERSNEDHVHFIAVLEGVLELLKPLRSTAFSRQAPSGKDSQRQTEDRDQNFYDALDLEDVAEPTIVQDVIPFSKTAGSKRTGKSKAKGKGKAKSRGHTFELRSSKEELYFTLFCFFKDLGDIRKHLCETWQNYKDGGIPLISASVSTDVAFDVIRIKEEQLLDAELSAGQSSVKATTLRDAVVELQKRRTGSAVPLYWRMKQETTLLNHGYLGEILYDYASSMNGNKISGSDIKDHASDQLYAIAEWLYIPSYIMLDQMDCMTGTCDVSGSPQHLSANFRSKSSAAGRSSAKKFHDDFGLFASVFTELMQLKASGMDDHMVPDAWTKAVLELSDPLREQQKKRMGQRAKREARNAMPVWLAFATTLFLDINGILGLAMDRAFLELRSVAQNAIRTIDLSLRWAREKPEPAWTAGHVSLLENVKTTLGTYVIKDLVTEIGAMMQDMGLDTQIERSPHYLIRHHPLWAAILQFWLQIGLWDCGIEMVRLFQSSACAETPVA